MPPDLMAASVHPIVTNCRAIRNRSVAAVAGGGVITRLSFPAAEREWRAGAFRGHRPDRGAPPVPFPNHPPARGGETVPSSVPFGRPSSGTRSVSRATPPSVRGAAGFPTLRPPVSRAGPRSLVPRRHVAARRVPFSRPGMSS